MTSPGGQQTPSRAVEVFPQGHPWGQGTRAAVPACTPTARHRCINFHNIFVDTLRGRVGMSGGDVLKANPVQVRSDI